MQGTAVNKKCKNAFDPDKKWNGPIDPARSHRSNHKVFALPGSRSHCSVLGDLGELDLQDIFSYAHYN